jgi:hypothetical protein
MEKDPVRAMQLADRFRGLSEHFEVRKEAWYGNNGRYAQVLDRHPLQDLMPAGPLRTFRKHDGFRVQLAPGTRWATAEDLLRAPAGELRTELRKRVGATLVILDFDRDGRPDLFLLGAVVEGGQVRDLLLHNEGGGQFRDVTEEMGLGDSWASLGCCVGDFDNDGFPDLFVTGAGR